ncbi:MAG: DUF3465 domain-containing protein [bacterium]|nr:DUF3465 domain-containing protein [bacterium]
MTKTRKAAVFIPLLILALPLLKVVSPSRGAADYTVVGETTVRPRPQGTSATPVARESDKVLQDAFNEQQSDLQVQGNGVVSDVLPDDLQGSRHQRFILRLSTGQTLLVAHNIDLAPRINELNTGDTVGFYGEYEWNEEGGVIHWTHRDPGGRHTDGWLTHDGATYQ